MNDAAVPGTRASTVNLPLYCMADRPSYAGIELNIVTTIVTIIPQWAAGGAAVGLTYARPCTVTTFLYQCALFAAGIYMNINVYGCRR